MDTVVIIPAYEPGEKLFSMAKELLAEGLDILVVDDGSSENCKEIFTKLGQLKTVSVGSADSMSVHIIHNEKNMGKGASLKIGMRAIAELFPEAKNVITADSDGQHLVSDICRVRDALKAGNEFVITTRDLKHSKTPFKSRIGNALSRFFFALANNHYLPDNQSGLRGFDVKHIEWMVNVSGNKYDYELNVLLYAEKQGIKAHKIATEAIYFDNNKETHFKPVIDTLKIYHRFFTTEGFAVMAVLLNIGMVIVSESIFRNRFIVLTCIACWVVYALLNFVVERYTLFLHIKYTPGVRRMIFSIFRYAIYGLICLVLNSFLGLTFVQGFLIAMVLTAIMEFYILKVSYDG